MIWNSIQVIYFNLNINPAFLTSNITWSIYHEFIDQSKIKNGNSTWRILCVDVDFVERELHATNNIKEGTNNDIGWIFFNNALNVFNEMLWKSGRASNEIKMWSWSQHTIKCLLEAWGEIHNVGYIFRRPCFTILASRTCTWIEICIATDVKLFELTVMLNMFLLDMYYIYIYVLRQRIRKIQLWWKQHNKISF